MGNKLILVINFVSRTLLYIIMDKIKEECITLIENYYCQRLTELVDMKMYDEARAIYEEFAVKSVDDPIEWFFMKDVEDDDSTRSKLKD